MCGVGSRAPVYRIEGMRRPGFARLLGRHKSPPARCTHGCRKLTNHFASGTDLFRVICDRDMEGIVAKQASAHYTPEATTWVKIKNRQYSQAVGREDFFNRRKGRE